MLAAGAVIALAGCQQMPPRPAGAPPLGSDNGAKPDAPITPAQVAELQISMGRAAEHQGDVEGAMNAYREAIARDGRRADAYLRLAVSHDKQGKFQEATEYYRKALKLRPGDPDIFCDMGYSYYLQRRWAEAEMNLRQAIAVNPRLLRAHNNLALVLVRNNQLDAALAEFKKGGSDLAGAHNNLAFALTLDRRWEEARAQYQRVLELAPNSQVAKARLEQVNALIAKAAPQTAGAPGLPQTLPTSTAAAPPQPVMPTASRGDATPNFPPGDQSLQRTANATERAQPAAIEPPSPAAVQPYRPAVVEPSRLAAVEPQPNPWWAGDSRSRAAALPSAQRPVLSQVNPTAGYGPYSGPVPAAEPATPTPASTASAKPVFIPPPRTFELSAMSRPDADRPANPEATTAPGITAPAATSQPGAAQAQATSRVAGPALPIDGSEVALRVLFAQAANRLAPQTPPADRPEANATMPGEGEPATLSPTPSAP
jgi:tetratricopeptide (TPR) repeat protein